MTTVLVLVEDELSEELGVGIEVPPGVGVGVPDPVGVGVDVGVGVGVGQVPQSWGQVAQVSP